MAIPLESPEKRPKSAGVRKPRPTIRVTAPLLRGEDCRSLAISNLVTEEAGGIVGSGQCAGELKHIPCGGRQKKQPGNCEVETGPGGGREKVDPHDGPEEKPSDRSGSPKENEPAEAGAARCDQHAPLEELLNGQANQHGDEEAAQGHVGSLASLAGELLPYGNLHECFETSCTEVVVVGESLRNLQAAHDFKGNKVHHPRAVGVAALECLPGILNFFRKRLEQTAGFLKS
jgi:hypothetical protein